MTAAPAGAPRAPLSHPQGLARGERNTRVLHRSPCVAIRDVHCMLDGNESAPGHQLWVVRSGAFFKHPGRKALFGLANHLFFFNRDESYNLYHPIEGGAQLTILEFAPSVVREALSLSDQAAADRHAPFIYEQGPAEPDALVLLRCLRQGLDDKTSTPLATEETATELLRRSICAAYPGRRAARSQQRVAGTGRSRKERVDAIKVMLAAHPGANHTLNDLAAAVYSSPFHIAHLFREEVGMPIHRYLTQLRLALALERLPDSAGSLSSLALDLGFSSHSHFSAAFAATFGLSPTALGRSASTNLMSEVRKILKA
jgi:AraC family transcriptional regulator